jgi:hypothetical protein
MVFIAGVEMGVKEDFLHRRVFYLDVYIGSAILFGYFSRAGFSAAFHSCLDGYHNDA